MHAMLASKYAFCKASRAMYKGVLHSVRGYPLQVAVWFLDRGCSTFVLRMGGDGSLLADKAERMVHWVPAAPAHIVDVTGCGNAYIGALIAGLQRGQSLQDAGAWASAAASCMAEAEGAAPAPATWLGDCSCGNTSHRMARATYSHDTTALVI
jgi:fructose-1-phosphate kinase PfkB-like protein